jgi:hypothetical protein
MALWYCSCLLPHQTVFFIPIHSCGHSFDPRLRSNIVAHSLPLVVSSGINNNRTSSSYVRSSGVNRTPTTSHCGFSLHLCALLWDSQRTHSCHYHRSSSCSGVLLLVPAGAPSSILFLVVPPTGSVAHCRSSCGHTAFLLFLLRILAAAMQRSLLPCSSTD